MTIILLAYLLGAVPVPPAPIHTPHIPPANPQLKSAPHCTVVAKNTSNNKLLTLRIKVCK